MENNVSKSHYRYKSIPLTQKICASLKEDTRFIDFISHGRHYDNGSGFALSSREDWMGHHCEKYLFISENTKKRLQTGCNYWKKNISNEISAIAEDARANFNIDARIEFVYRDEANKCYHLYSFYSDRKNADRAYSFYGLHSAKLIKFIAYFNKAASHLITEANKPENLITITDYTPPPLPELHRKFVDEMKAVGASVNLGDRETEVMILYAAGCSYEQIAEMFCRSPKTIKNHIQHIKQKTGCKDRKDFNVYVRDLGLSGMERFFFSYFSRD
jgi:DNA-binding CsgD family transcriptional regulator